MSISNNRNSHIELSVIIPAFREAQNLNILLPRLKLVLNSIKEVSSEILVIDGIEVIDDSKTISLKEKALYFNRKNDNSYGSAVKTGIMESSGKYKIFMDADGSHEPEFIPHLFKNRNNCHVAIASRYVAGGETENSKILIFMSFIVNFVYSKVLNLKCKDVSNSFKLYRGEDLGKLTLSCSNFDIIEEILYKLVRKNPHLKIIEIPARFKKRMFGETKRNLVLFAISYIYTLLKLRFSRV